MGPSLRKSGVYKLTAEYLQLYTVLSLPLVALRRSLSAIRNFLGLP